MGPIDLSHRRRERANSPSRRPVAALAAAFLLVGSVVAVAGDGAPPAAPPDAPVAPVAPASAASGQSKRAAVPWQEIV